MLGVVSRLAAGRSRGRARPPRAIPTSLAKREIALPSRLRLIAPRCGERRRRSWTSRFALL